MSKLVALGLVLVLAALLLAGCGGGNNQTVFQWVMRNVSWNPAGTRVAFAAYGGNGILYVYSISSTGGNLTLLTPTDNDKDLTDEGGEQPAWSPDGTDLAIVARRGGTQALFLIDPTVGASRRQTRITTDDVAIPGEDAHPSWKPDSTQLVYVSNKNSAAGLFEIHLVNRDGSGDRVIARADDANDAQWPVFTPDGTQIVYQSGIGRAGQDTSLRILTVPAAGAGAVATTAIPGTEGNGFRDETPSVGSTATGVRLAFASDRNGDFDIWTMALDGSGATAVTEDARADLWPAWNPGGTRIALNRDNEAWSIAADGSDQKQLTKRFENR